MQLATVAQLESGHTPSRNILEYWGGDIPWLSLHDTDVLDKSEVFNTSQSVTQKGIDNSSARVLPKGTVVFSRTATVGKATVLGREMATSQDFACYICGPRVLNHFLVYLFRYMAPEWRRYMAGSTHNTVYMPVFRTLRVPLPPRPEQEAIAEALRDADALIESLEQLIKKKRQIKQGAMQGLLSGRRRLPGFSGDWTSEQLGSLLSRRPAYGLNAPAVPYDTRHPAYIRITDITDDGRFDPTARASVIHPTAELYRLEPGDLVLARTGASTGKSYLYRETDGELVFAGFLIRISPDQKKLSPRYLRFQLDTAAYREWVRANSMRSGQPGINGRQYASMPVPLPPTRAEQEAIAEALTDMGAEIEALELRLKKARQIKQGMMQELLTGRVRLV